MSVHEAGVKSGVISGPGSDSDPASGSVPAIPTGSPAPPRRASATYDAVPLLPPSGTDLPSRPLADALQQPYSGREPNPTGAGAPPMGAVRTYAEPTDGLGLRFSRRERHVGPYPPLVLHEQGLIIDKINAVLKLLGHTTGINHDGVCMALAQLALQEAYLRDRGLVGNGFFEALDAFMFSGLVTAYHGGILCPAPSKILSADEIAIRQSTIGSFDPTLLASIDSPETQAALKRTIEHQALYLGSVLQLLHMPGNVFDTPEQVWFNNADVKQMGILCGLYQHAELVKDLEDVPAGCMCGISLDGHAISAVRHQDRSWSFYDPNDPYADYAQKPAAPKQGQSNDKFFHITTTKDLARYIFLGATLCDPGNRFAEITISLFMTQEDLSNAHLAEDTMIRFRPGPYKPGMLFSVFQDSSPDILRKILAMGPTRVERLDFMVDQLSPENLIVALAYATIDDIRKIIAVIPKTESGRILSYNKVLAYAEETRRNNLTQPGFTTPADAITFLKTLPPTHFHSMYRLPKNADIDPLFKIHILECLLPENSPARSMLRHMRENETPDLSMEQKVFHAWSIYKKIVRADNVSRAPLSLIFLYDIIENDILRDDIQVVRGDTCTKKEKLSATLHAKALVGCLPYDEVLMRRFFPEFII